MCDSEFETGENKIKTRRKIELQHVGFFTQLVLVFLGKKILNWFDLTGIVAQLPQELSTFLTMVQVKLSKVIKSVGKIDHSLYPLTICLTDDV